MKKSDENEEEKMSDLFGKCFPLCVTTVSKYKHIPRIQDAEDPLPRKYGRNEMKRKIHKYFLIIFLLVHFPHFPYLFLVSDFWFKGNTCSQGSHGTDDGVLPIWRKKGKTIWDTGKMIRVRQGHIYKLWKWWGEIWRAFGSFFL